jgi:hypothetical protein
MMFEWNEEAEEGPTPFMSVAILRYRRFRGKCDLRRGT